MPLYDYHCESCDVIVEIQHKLAESAPPCETCEGELVRQIAAVQGSVAGPTGPIFHDKQIQSSHGDRWRETPNSDTPGGAGKKAFSIGKRGGNRSTRRSLPPGTWK